MYRFHARRKSSPESHSSSFPSSTIHSPSVSGALSRTATSVSSAIDSEDGGARITTRLEKRIKSPRAPVEDGGNTRDRAVKGCLRATPTIIEVRAGDRRQRRTYKVYPRVPSGPSELSVGARHFQPQRRGSLNVCSTRREDPHALLCPPPLYHLPVSIPSASFINYSYAASFWGPPRITE